MDVFINFITVASVIWVTLYTLITVLVFTLIATQSQRDILIRGRYRYNPSPWAIALYLASVSWLIARFFL